MKGAESSELVITTEQTKDFNPSWYLNLNYVMVTQNKRKESENSYQKLKRSQ